MTPPLSPSPLRPPRTGRYVILAHQTHDGLHWDLMLEWGDILKTWSLAQEPDRYSTTLIGTPLPDHRILYLDYEGPISGNRGEVRRWDTGRFTLIAETSKTWTIEFDGERLRGTYSLGF